VEAVSPSPRRTHAAWAVALEMAFLLALLIVGY
jgi:hypothetical protein